MDTKSLGHWFPMPPTYMTVRLWLTWLGLGLGLGFRDKVKVR